MYKVKNRPFIKSPKSSLEPIFMFAFLITQHKTHHFRKRPPPEVLLHGLSKQFFTIRRNPKDFSARLEKIKTFEHQSTRLTLGSLAACPNG